ESLRLLRLLLTAERVTFDGEFFTVSDATVGTLPAKPLDIWLGGSAPAGLRRVGRLADGWLGSLLTPAEAGAAVKIIQDAAAEARREVEDDHFGLSLPVTLEGIPAPLLASINRRRPEADPATLVARGWDDARRMNGPYVEAGRSKFVVRPATPGPFGLFLDGFVRDLLPIQNYPRLARDAVVQHKERQAEPPERVLGPQLARLDVDVEPLGEPAHGRGGQLGR